MSTDIQRPPDEVDCLTSSGGLDDFQRIVEFATLGDLPVGSRLILRCRKDWRDATVAAVSLEQITLLIGSPSGHTYRVRRPSASLLSFDGSIPVLGEGCWRAGRVRYDLRW